jgi:hypothetical protein
MQQHSLQKIRTERNLSPLDMALLLDIDEALYLQYENNPQQIPLITFFALIEKLGMPDHNPGQLFRELLADLFPTFENLSPPTTRSFHGPFRNGSDEYFRLNETFYGNPTRFSMNDDPFTIIENVFIDLHLIDLRITLSDLLETALTSDSDYYKDPTDRANVMYNVTRIEEIIEAAFLYYINKSSSRKKTV